MLLGQVQSVRRSRGRGKQWILNLMMFSRAWLFGIHDSGTRWLLLVGSSAIGVGYLAQENRDAGGVRLVEFGSVTIGAGLGKFAPEDGEKASVLLRNLLATVRQSSSAAFLLPCFPSLCHLVPVPLGRV